MADAAFLARMKDGALLVNAARGSLLRTDALVAELRQGRLRAALDVTDPEPLPAGHPLWTLPGVFITPHEAASTPVSLARMISHVRDQAEILNGARSNSSPAVTENVPLRKGFRQLPRSWHSRLRTAAEGDVSRWTLFLNRSVT